MPNPLDLIQGIETTLSSGDFPKARALIQQLLSTELKNEGLYWSAVCDLSEGNIRNAVSGFAEVVKNNPKHSKAYYGLGIAYEAAGKLSEAKKFFAHTLVLDPGQVHAAQKFKQIQEKENSQQIEQTTPIEKNTQPIGQTPSTEQVQNKVIKLSDKKSKIKRNKKKNNDQKVDYEKLEDLLSNNRLKEADFETASLLNKLAGSSKLNPKNIIKIPTTELQKIDVMWRKYTQERFSFSRQMQLYQGKGGNLASTEFNDKTWENLAYSLDWMHGSKIRFLKKISQITFSESATPGHLPASWVLSLSVKWPSEGWGFLLFTVAGAFIGGSLARRDASIGYVAGGLAGALFSSFSSLLYLTLRRLRDKKVAKRMLTLFSVLAVKK